MAKKLTIKGWVEADPPKKKAPALAPRATVKPVVKPVAPKPVAVKTVAPKAPTFVAAPRLSEPKPTAPKATFKPAAVDALKKKVTSTVKPVQKAVTKTATRARAEIKAATAPPPKVNTLAVMKALLAKTKQPTNKPLTSQPKVVPPTVKTSPGGLRGNATEKLQTPVAPVAPAAAQMPVQAAQPPVTAVAPAEAQSPVAPPVAAPPSAPPAAAGTPPNVIPAYQPQVPTATGLGTEYDSVYGAEVGRENQRGAAFDAANAELDMPTKDDFTKPWDATEEKFQGEYDKRYGRMTSQWDEQKAALQAEYQGKLAQISAAQQNANSGIQTAVGQAGTNASGYGAPAQQAGQPIDGSQYLGGLGAAGAAQQQGLNAPAAPTNLASSAITPEILNALISQYQATTAARASSANNAASSDNLEQTRLAYGKQGDVENDLLDVFGRTGTANTNGRTGSIKDYYSSNQGAVGKRTDLLDKQYQESAANKQAMTDIASGGRNAADNRQSGINNVLDNETSVGNNIRTNRQSGINNDADNLQSGLNNDADNLQSGVNNTADNVQSGKNTEYRVANTPPPASQKPRLIKGDEYISIKLSKSPAAAAVVRQVASRAATVSKEKYLPVDPNVLGADGKPDAKRVNPYWGDPDGAARDILKANPTKMDKAALAKYLAAYSHGETYVPPAPKAVSTASPKGSNGGTVAQALSQVGVKEGAGNSNPYSQRTAGVRGQAWCQDFVNDTLASQGKKFPPGAKVSGTRASLKAWQKAGRSVPMNQLQPGDVVYKSRGNDNTKGHVGIVVSVKNGVITTVEGNAGPGSTMVSKQTSTAAKWDLGAIRP